MILRNLLLLRLFFVLGSPNKQGDFCGVKVNE